MSHVWGLFSHPDREMQVINRENETISHHYMIRLEINDRG